MTKDKTSLNEYLLLSHTIDNLPNKIQSSKAQKLLSSLKATLSLLEEITGEKTTLDDLEYFSRWDAIMKLFNPLCFTHLSNPKQDLLLRSSYADVVIAVRQLEAYMDMLGQKGIKAIERASNHEAMKEYKLGRSGIIESIKIIKSKRNK